MRNLVYLGGPKTSDLPSSGLAKFCWLLTMCQNTAIYYVFATLAPQTHPKRSILAIFGLTMSATPQFELKIGPNLTHVSNI